MRLQLRIYETHSFADAVPGEPNPSMDTVFFDMEIQDERKELRYTLGRLFFLPGFLEERGFDTHEFHLDVIDERDSSVRDTSGHSASRVGAEV